MSPKLRAACYRIKANYLHSLPDKRPIRPTLQELLGAPRAGVGLPHSCSGAAAVSESPAEGLQPENQASAQRVPLL